MNDPCGGDWQPVRIRSGGMQPHMTKEWDCLPAWDVVAVYPQPDEFLPYPESARAAAPPPEDRPYVKTGRPVFWNRHIDRRFHIEYPPTTREAPRVRGKTVGDADREWDTLIKRRDLILQASGLTAQSDPLEVVRCLAETYKWTSPFYNSKENGAVIDGERTRALNHPIDGLMHQCWCVGCAYSMAALADSCGIPARTIAIGGHHIAEVCVRDKWYFCENSCRHEDAVGLEAFIGGSWMDVTLAPERFLSRIPPRKPGDYWAANSGQYCLMGGTWRSPMILEFAADCAYALYPTHERWGIKALPPGRDGGYRLPIALRLGGFQWGQEAYWGEKNGVREYRRKNAPFPVVGNGPGCDYLYHPLRPGDGLRHSIWLDGLEEMQRLEVTFPFAPEPHVAFDEAFGRGFTVRVGDWGGDLVSLGAWTPEYDAWTGHVHVTVSVPPDALTPHAVNWIVLRHGGRLALKYPMTVSAMEPYLPPLLAS